MQAALKKADHEGVTSHARAQVIGECSREIVTRRCAERFAGAKPDERSGLEARAKRGHPPRERVRGRQRAAIEALAVDERSPPLAVTPELELADRAAPAPRREKIEGICPTPRAVCGVDASEAAVQGRARFPSETERPRRSDALSRVINEQSEWRRQSRTA
jgi:hypothetical protein